MSEVSISGNKGEILYYDKAKGEWAPPSKGGFSRIDIFHKQETNSYRLVGMTAKDPRQVVINSHINSKFELKMVTPLFVQFDDFDIQFGIKFASKEEADSFYSDFEKTLKTVKANKENKKTTQGNPNINNTNANIIQKPILKKTKPETIQQGKAFKNMTWQELIDSLTSTKKVSRAAILGSSGKFALASSASFKIAQAEGSPLQAFFERDPTVTQNFQEKGFLIGGTRFRYTSTQNQTRPLALFGLDDSGKHCVVCFGNESIWIALCTEDQLIEAVHSIPEMVLEKDCPKNIYAK